ncbi:hypothetical protein [Deinococcus hohokamensis]|uniref:ArsR family transcriptional regulator n=1 Tax=Deinococcus hohokamensis TaxID=309883 RepID=A0ABV9IA36_9DEIO
MTDPLATPFQVTTPAQAEALLDFTYGARLLEKFMEPSTPSQAAHALAEPANRVAYHVRKLLQSGLLRVAGRQGKRVLYQTAAQTFHVPRALVRLDEPLTLIEPVMREITSAYAHAVLGWQLRQDSSVPAGDAAHLAVSLGPPGPHPTADPPAGVYAPAMRLRSVRVTPEQYQQAQAALDRILTELESSQASPSAHMTTFVVMTFPGRLHDT